MEKVIFVNLPVTDLARSIAFYEAIGAVSDPNFRDEQGQMLRFSDAICLMVLTRERFSDFTSHAIADPRAVAHALLTLSEESREAVDATVGKAVAAGGVADPSPIEDYGWMYGRSFADPDGHQWGLSWLDLEAALAAGGAAEAQPA